MNIFKISNIMSDGEGETNEEASSRRLAIKKLFSFGTKAAIASVPIIAGSLFQKAYGQADAPETIAFNRVLKYNFLQYVFYNQLLEKAPIPAGDILPLTLIRDSEFKLFQYITESVNRYHRAADVTKNFDFTANGVFPDVFTNYETTLAVAQIIEDLGVRYIKNQCTGIVQSFELTELIGVHQTQSLHAAKIRLMRRENGFQPTLKPYITKSTENGLSAFNEYYLGEGNIIQMQADVTKLPGINGNITVKTATEAFDEQLRTAQIEPVLNLFIRK